MVNIIQMLIVIVLSTLLDFDCHMLIIIVESLWKLTYVHLVLFGLISVLRYQANDNFNSSSIKKNIGNF
jgi:hypothetical protein